MIPKNLFQLRGDPLRLNYRARQTGLLNNLRSAISVWLIVVCLTGSTPYVQAQSWPMSRAMADFQPPALEPAVPSAPQATGGPDDFGYTYSTDVPFEWIDALGGPDTGLANDCGLLGSVTVPIGFDFKFYENTYSTVNVSFNGGLMFDRSDACAYNISARISSASPNNFISVYWKRFKDAPNKVHYLQGGVAPNRYLVIEWFQVDDSTLANTYTFEAILHENGDIVLQYLDMTIRNNQHPPGGAGIQDNYGTIGLAPFGLGTPLVSRSAARIYRPAPAVRTLVDIPADGRLGLPGTKARYFRLVRNAGDFGPDTFDLQPASNWPLAFYTANGVDPLTDTDGDGVIDTGSVPQGGVMNIVIETTIPAEAVPPQANAVVVTLRSSVDTNRTTPIVFYASVPPPFVQSYEQTYTPFAALYGPRFQSNFATGDGPSYESAVATLPNGNLIQVYSLGRYTLSGVYYEDLYSIVLDQLGRVVQPAAKITDFAAGTPVDIYNTGVAIAVAPNGTVGVVWSQFIGPYGSPYIPNVFFIPLNDIGRPIAPLIQLTNNQAVDYSSFSYLTLAAVTNNRFVIAWDDTDLVYTVLEATGAVVKPATSVAGGGRPSLTRLADGTAFLAGVSCTPAPCQITSGRIDQAGNFLNSPTVLPNAFGRGVDAVQLPNGNIVLAWENSDSVIRYAVLDAGLNLVRGVTDLSSVTRYTKNRVSVTYSGNQAILTWGDSNSSTGNLYYALLDGQGELLAYPMIFARGTNAYLETSINGQGNTFIIPDETPPTNPISLTSDSHLVGGYSANNVINMAWSGAADNSTGVAGYSVSWTNAPTTLPDTIQEIAHPMQNTQSPPLADGEWYVHLRTVDGSGNWAATAVHLGPFIVDRTAPRSVASSPEFATRPFTVTWGGNDALSRVAAYNLSVRDSLTPEWTPWLTNVTYQTAAYTEVIPGHTYLFRSEAVDRAGNIETDVPSEGDTHTTLAALQISGRVQTLRGQPVFNASVATQPGALNVAHTDGQGQYTVFLETSGVYTFTAQRSEFGALPAVPQVAVQTDLANYDFVLPPESEQMVNGGWEGGTFAGWEIGAGLTTTRATPIASPLFATPLSATITATLNLTAAHSGQYGLQINASKGISILTPLLAQTVTVPMTDTQPTLSWLYRLEQGQVELIWRVSGTRGVLTRTLSLTSTIGWQHAWLDLSDLGGETVRVELAIQNSPGALRLAVDEISLGAVQSGNYPIHLPIITFNQ